MSFRFANDHQKALNVTILGDLLKDAKDDQLATIALTNALALAQTTMVRGDLDKMIADTNRMFRRSVRVLSVFLLIFAASELAFGWLQWRAGATVGAFATLAFVLAILAYAFGLHVNWRIQQRYHRSLKDLERFDEDLPKLPHGLQVVKH